MCIYKYIEVSYGKLTNQTTLYLQMSLQHKHTHVVHHIYICINIYIYINKIHIIYTRIYIYIYLYVYIYIYALLYAYIYLYVCIYIYTHYYMHIYIYLYNYINIIAVDFPQSPCIRSAVCQNRRPTCNRKDVVHAPKWHSNFIQQICLGWIYFMHEFGSYTWEV